MSITTDNTRKNNTAQSGKCKQIKVRIYFVLFFLAINANLFCQDSSYIKKFLDYRNSAGRNYFIHPDSTLYYGNICLELAIANNDVYRKALSYNLIGYGHWLMSNEPTAIGYFLKARDFAMLVKDKKSRDEILVETYDGLGCAFCSSGFYEQGFDWLKQSQGIAISLKDNYSLLNELSTIGMYYEKINKNDSALIYLNEALKLCEIIGEIHLYQSIIYKNIGNVYENLHLKDSALRYWRLNIATAYMDYLSPAESYLKIGKAYMDENNSDSAYANLTRSIENYNIAKNIEGQYESHKQMASFFKQENKQDSFYRYLEKSYEYKDSLFNNEKRSQLNSYSIDEMIREKEINVERIDLKNKIRLYILLSVLAIVLITVFLLFRNNQRKQKANTLLQVQKNESNRLREIAEAAVEQLQDSQSQLIQSEKMASLGELTAGIAHEIQNPLNFVNNFSEVNKEMIAEMKEEINKGNYNEAKTIANDIESNEEKINHHGKRADAIVKGMLQHSRLSTGAKELTDINALCDEYLRLSYHGIRAKDKSFNTEIKTDFDRDLSSVEGKINIVPQDIGRVLLNLYNNAFYAVSEPSNSLKGEQYKPLVTVTTKAVRPPLGDLGVLISVADNGNGIPQNIVDKIFQPFFTTKPTGQGTGLGLSLSYDIIKAHGGTITLESTESTGSVFIINLPLKG